MADSLPQPTSGARPPPFMFTAGPDQGRGLTPGPAAGQFDIYDWYPAHQSCHKFFVDVAQYNESVLAVCALINISLPHQWHPDPIRSTTAPQTTSQRSEPQYPPYKRPHLSEPSHPTPPSRVSLIPFMRRLVVTGFDREPVLHGFFGDDWRKGVGPLQECERRNYLFAAKSVGWAQVKSQYDMGPRETVPFLQPPHSISVGELENAEKLWSQWLSMEDWMVGPRAPSTMEQCSRHEAGPSWQPHPPSY